MTPLPAALFGGGEAGQELTALLPVCCGYLWLLQEGCSPLSPIQPVPGQRSCSGTPEVLQVSGCCCLGTSAWVAEPRLRAGLALKLLMPCLSEGRAYKIVLLTWQVLLNSI